MLEEFFRCNFSRRTIIEAHVNMLVVASRLVL